MVSKVLVVLLLACTATAVLGGENNGAKLEKRADGLITQLMNFSVYLTKSGIDKLQSLGHTGLNAAEGLIDFGANTVMNTASRLLRRDLNYDQLSNVIAQSQSDLDKSWMTATKLARKTRPTLSPHGQQILDQYMNELKVSRMNYMQALQNGAADALDMQNRLSSSDLSDNDEIWGSIQDDYAVEMADYVNQVRRLGRVYNNGGFEL